MTGCLSLRVRYLLRPLVRFVVEDQEQHLGLVIRGPHQAQPVLLLILSPWSCL